MGIVSKKCYTRSCKTHANYQHWFSIQHFLSCQNPNKSSRKDFWKNSWKEISIHEFCQWSYIIVLTEFSAQSKSSPSDVFSRKHCRVSNEHSKLVSSEISFKKLNIVNCQINCKFAWLWKPDCFVSEEYFQMCVFLVCISINILLRKPFISIWMCMYLFYRLRFKSIYWNKRHCNVGCIILTRQLVTELSREPWVAGARELAVELALAAVSVLTRVVLTACKQIRANTVVPVE